MDDLAIWLRLPLRPWLVLLAGAWGPGGAAGDSITNSLGMTLVELPAGEFVMGMADHESWQRYHKFFAHTTAASDSDRPPHRVRLSRPFLVGAREVTVGQFRSFVEATGYRTVAERDGKGASVFDPKAKTQVGRFTPQPDANWRHPGFEQDDRHPVVCVSERDADAFCQWLGAKEGETYRLPTEAEWEYACRAGTQTLYCSGDDPDTLDQHGNVADASLETRFPGEVLRQRADHLGDHDGDGHVFTAPAGNFRPNAWGLYDLHGNVWEWCRDRFHDRYYEDLAKQLRDQRRKGLKESDLAIDDPQGRDPRPRTPARLRRSGA